jgi:hypothetical protein
MGLLSMSQRMGYGMLVRGRHPIAKIDKALRLLEALIRPPGWVLKSPFLVQSGLSCPDT